MEENIVEQTPMGKIWTMIILSGSFVFCVAWLWHWSEMRAVEANNQKENAKVEVNIAILSAYRDVLKEKGKDEALKYIEQVRKEPYGI